MTMSNIRVVITTYMVVAALLGPCEAQLSSTFYSASCPNITEVVMSILTPAFQNDVRIGAKIIRMHFHDCMVNGCDGSLLLDDGDGIETEKTTPPNQSITGYNVVDDIKAELESVCPGVVSCADILAIASQIGVALAQGSATSWTAELGRRDRPTANRAGTTAIPSPFDSITEVKRKFDDVNLDSIDLVALSGAHTFGVARCPTFIHRLYNFSGTGSPDPSIDATYLQMLQQTCPDGGNGNGIENLDKDTPNLFDNRYFTNLQTNRGLLQTDQDLFSTPGEDTIGIVNQFANSQTDFFNAFGASMIKLGAIRPLTGTNGEIRAVCGRPN